jgi:hypothetical protein
MPKSVKFFNKNLNFNFFSDKKAGFFLKLGPRPPATFEFAGTSGHGPQVFKITGGHGQRAAKCHVLLTSNVEYIILLPCQYGDRNNGDKNNGDKIMGTK